MPWKTTKKAYRVSIEVIEPNDQAFVFEEDILENELDPDTMSDLFSYLFWFADDGWEIVNVEEIELFDWKEMRITHRWRDFFELYGDGEGLCL